jgi:hypothetical protein
MRIDDMGPEQVARYTQYRSTLAELESLARHLRLPEQDEPGYTSRIAAMSAEEQGPAPIPYPPC